MTQNRLLLLLALLCSTVNSAHAQLDNGSEQALSVTLGTQGIGIDYTRYVHSNIAVRIGGSHLPFSLKYRNAFNQVDTDVKLKSESFTNAHLMVDIHPIPELGLRITPGAGWFFNAKGIATVQPSGNYKYGDITVTGEQLGSMEGTISWNGIAPYLGAGWLFRFREGESPLSLGIDLGTYWLPRPDATLTGTNLFENNAYNQEKFKENVKNYRWLPLGQISLRYRLNAY